MSQISPLSSQWDSGTAYERYMGRWSRLVAGEFLRWLDVAPGAAWLDVGCGTGALSQTILNETLPGHVTGIDRSPEFVAYAQAQIGDARVRFEVGDAQELEIDSRYDNVVSALMLNFIPDKNMAVTGMARAAKPGGTVALYVWDYADRMDLMRYFWDAAGVLHPAALDLDEGRRFSICKPEPLTDLFRAIELDQVDVRPIDIPTHFGDFDDYWRPFLGGTGTAPSYVATLSEQDRAALRDALRARLPIHVDGSIKLLARAWAVRGRRV